MINRNGIVSSLAKLSNSPISVKIHFAIVRTYAVLAHNSYMLHRDMTPQLVCRVVYLVTSQYASKVLTCPPRWSLVGASPLKVYP